MIARAKELFPTLWIELHKIKNESGLPIEFIDHYFMMDLYNDMSMLQVWLKPPQIGATVAQLLKTLYCAKKQKLDIIYTLPTQSDVNDMAGGKINRLIAQNPVLLDWVRDHDTVDQKAVGENIIYYRGTFTTKQAMMVSSDLNVHDEVDASDASVIQQYETRLQAKANGRRWYFSHPSDSGRGVDVYWQQSDKKEWFIFCNYCGLEQELKWPDNVDVVKREYICKHCKEILNTNARRYGVWKKTSNGIFSGYHISQLMCPWITADKIVTDYETKDIKYFYNYVLGLPYVSSENRITADDVLLNCTPKVNTQDDRIIIGVDTGLPIHYVCLNKQGIFDYGTCKDYIEIERLLNKYDRSVLVADQGGDLIGIRTLQAKYAGRVFLCYYRHDRKSKDMITWGKDKDFGTVTVDRNRMIQIIVDQLKERNHIYFNGSKEDFQEFAEHFENIYRVKKVKEEKTMGVEYDWHYVWERNGPDHYVHALLYALTGLDKYATQMAVIVGDDIYSGMNVGRTFLQ